MVDQEQMGVLKNGHDPLGLLQTFDENGDGDIDKDEFKTFLAQEMEELLHGKLSKTYSDW